MRPVMIAQGEISSVLYTWLFIICCVYIWSAGYALKLKKKGWFFMSASFCLICFFGIQTMQFVISAMHGIFFANVFTLFSALPAGAWITITIAMSAMAVYTIMQMRKWQKNNITPMTIKDCGDSHPVGIVFWSESGRVMYANAAADNISVLLCGNPVMNGFEFLKAFESAKAVELAENAGRKSDENGDRKFDENGDRKFDENDNHKLLGSPDRATVELGDGSLKSLCHRILIMDKEPVHELTAVDVTELYRKTEEIYKDTERLICMKKELNEYNRNIESLVKDQEILKAKVRIHDEMNYLLMASGHSFEKNDKEKQDEILRLWEKNSELLFTEHDKIRTVNITEDLKTYAELVGIEFVCERIPDDIKPDRMKFIILAAREAMTNAVKYGDAVHLYASFKRDNDTASCTFENDGSIPKESEIVFKGGLAHLKNEAESLGGMLKTEADDKFRIVITLPEAIETKKQ